MIAKSASCLLAFFLWVPLFASAHDAAQLTIIRNAERLNSDASNRARNLGRNSIGRGLRHMRHGRHHHNPGEVRLGAFEIAQGILGLLAAAAAEGMANKDARNGDGLDQIPSGNSDSSAPSKPEGLGQSAQGGISGQSRASLDSATLESSNRNTIDIENPETKNALDAIKEEYGFSPTQFVKMLDSGTDVKSLFENAPKNALTPEQTKVAWVESRKLPDTSGENSTVSAAQDSPASKQATDKAVPALTGAAGNLSRNQDDLRESLRKKLDEYEDYELSPEVKAALAAREQKERAEQNAPKVDLELNLFDVVRRKYRERENHMRWGEPLRSTGS